MSKLSYKSQDYILQEHATLGLLHETGATASEKKYSYKSW